MNNSDNPFINEFQTIRQKTAQEVLSILLDKDNLELKTHIIKPKHLAVLKVLAKYLESLKYKKTATVIFDFLDVYLTYMVSYNRLSRKEIVSAIQNIVQEPKEQFTPTENLMRNLK